MPRVVPDARCLACHDTTHSDAFAVQAARERVVMPGHGRAP
jgi:hypothetical protein